jgi:plastocyanin
MGKNVLIGIIVAAAIILIGTFAYVLTRPTATDTTTTTPTPTEPSTTETSEAPATENTPQTESAATITYTDSGFDPSTTTVKKGSTITVTNKSTKDVKFSSADHPTHQKQPELNMETLKPGESGTITVTKVGTWGFHDHIDASMTGMIVVTE